MRGGGGEGCGERRAGHRLVLYSTFPSSQVPGGSQDPAPGGPLHPQPVCQLQCPAAGRQEAAHGGKCSRSLCPGQLPGRGLAFLTPELCDSSSQQPGRGLPTRAQGTWEGSGLEERGGGPEAARSHLQGSVIFASHQLGCPGSLPGVGFPLETNVFPSSPHPGVSPPQSPWQPFSPPNLLLQIQKS